MAEVSHIYSHSPCLTGANRGIVLTIVLPTHLGKRSSSLAQVSPTALLSGNSVAGTVLGTSVTEVNKPPSSVIRFQV